MRTYDLPSGVLVNLYLQTDGTTREGHLDVKMSLVAGTHGDVISLARDAGMVISFPWKVYLS